MKFRTILADPPWCYQNFSARKNGSAASHYSTMGDGAIATLPVASVAEKDCVLLLWCTWPKLKEGIDTLEGWGFRYVSGFPWVKMQSAATPRVGIGFHTRSASEFVLIGVRGRITPPPPARKVGVIFSPVGRHSAKPDAQYEFAEAYGGPYLEMFARPDGGLFPARPGWTRIGNEITGRDIAEDLCILAGDGFK